MMSSVVGLLLGDGCKAEAILPSPPVGSRLEGVPYTSNAGKKWECNLSVLPRQASIETQGFVGNYKTWQKITRIFKDLQGLQAK